MLSLPELQRRFFAVLTEGARRTGEAAGDDRPATVDPVLLGLVRDRGALGAAERLEIYARMYRDRLVDVLREDYPRVLAIVGDEAFGALVGRYLARWPSRRPSVRQVGGRFAEFLAAEPSLPPFLGDLARLEWARVEVFDAPDAEPLRAADLEAVPPEDWPGLRLRSIPAHRIVESAWPVHRVWILAETSPAGLAERVGPEATVLRVWREGWAVSHAAMGAVEHAAFRALELGRPFAELCETLGGGLDAEEAARTMGSILMRWIEDGLLAAPTGKRWPA